MLTGAGSAAKTCWLPMRRQPLMIHEVCASFSDFVSVHGSWLVDGIHAAVSIALQCMCTFARSASCVLSALQCSEPSMTAAVEL